MNKEKTAKRYRRIYRFFRPALKLFLRIVLNYRCRTERVPEGPLFIVSNHTSVYDALFVAAAFKEPVYFVGGEHLWRMGKILRWFLDRYGAVIQRVKAATDASSASGILRALRDGKNVCLYPEGNTSFTGGMMPFHPTTARLIKAAKGATLVTFRVTGGYFSTPRWSSGRRRGYLSGAVTAVYPPETVDSLSTDEIESILMRDIAVDAYALQRENPRPYRGKRLAEYLETALYLCPRCMKIGLLHSRGDEFYCECGLHATLDAYGEFHGDDLPFRNPQEWDNWQEAQIKDLAGRYSAKPYFSDPDQTLWEQHPDHSERIISSGEMSMSSERFSLGKAIFGIKEITGMDLSLKDRLHFVAGSRRYTVATEHLRSGRKYVTMFKYLKERACTGASENNMAAIP